MPVDEGQVHAPLWGLSTAGAPRKMAEFDELTELVGATPDLLLYFRGWPYDDFDAAEAEAVRQTGATPLLTWEPYDYLRGPDQPEYALATIVNGHHDGYIRTFARDVAAWGGRLLLRFAHEMNLRAYPWSAEANGNTPAEYVAAWRHVHHIFDVEGADNVEWVWAPNVSSPGSTPLESVYPGDDVVDWIGLDGYNGGTALDWGGWLTFEQLFSPTLEEVEALTDRPVLITETGSAEAGGDRAQWLRDAFAHVQADERIRGLVYFNHDREADWRVQVSPDSATAFADGINRLRRRDGEANR